MNAVFVFTLYSGNGVEYALNERALYAFKQIFWTYVERADVCRIM